MTFRTLAIVLLVCAAASPGRAEDAPVAEESPREAEGETIVVPGRDLGPDDLAGDDPRSANAGDALYDPSFVSSFHLDATRGELTSAGELASRSQGVRARSLGGLGSFSSVSIRGQDPGHTAVIVDGVPLSTLSTATRDVSALDLGASDTLRVYRGGGPLLSGASGGAVAVESSLAPDPEGRELWLSGGFGSLSTRHLRARTRGGNADASRLYTAGLGYRGTDGDFSYYSDNGTRLNTDDDSVERRTNNSFNQVFGVARVGGSDDSSHWATGLRASYLDQGVPGPAHDQSTSASLSTGFVLADVELARQRWLGSALDAALLAYLSAELSRYRDPMSEIGLEAQDRRYLTAVAGVRPTIARQLGAHRASLGIDSRLESFDEDDLMGLNLPVSSGQRLATAAYVEDRWQSEGGAVELAPALRLDAVRTSPTSERFDPDAEIVVRNEAAVSPRMGARFNPAPIVALKGNAGRYLRAPTLLELFGDRGFVVGSPSLEAETGWSVDAGAVVASDADWRGLDRFFLEVVGFANRSDRAIVFVAQNGLVGQAQNIEGARTLGAEASASVRLRRFATVQLAYTLVDARSRAAASRDNQLPGRPRHDLYARLELARVTFERLVVLYGDAAYASGNFLDEANVFELPARRLFGAGAKVEILADLFVSLEVKNVMDRRVEMLELSPPPGPTLERIPRSISDFHGYPLPGRAFYASVDWAH